MADMESICAWLSLLTHAAWREGLPAPFSRASVSKMIRLGALEGLTLRKVPGIQEEHYLRAEALLSRSSEIYAQVEQCQSQGYSVLLPQDDLWPAKLCVLGAYMPQFLFVRGNLSLFSMRCVSAAGSRKVDGNTEKIACKLGREIAQKGHVLVCGGAHGVDTALQSACLDAGGNLILVPARPCDDLLRQEYLRSALQEGRLLLAGDTWPQERFSAHKALKRNHTIYALGDAAIAVASRKGLGGTWRGATDCLRGGYTPVFVVCEDGCDFDGNRAMLSLGARELSLSISVAQQMFSEGGMDT